VAVASSLDKVIHQIKVTHPWKPRGNTLSHESQIQETEYYPWVSEDECYPAQHGICIKLIQPFKKTPYGF